MSGVNGAYERNSTGQMRSASFCPEFPLMKTLENLLDMWSGVECWKGGSLRT